MTLQQLYYTSCIEGLSGFSGYQFNAATPGVAPETMSRVERFSVYEAPPSMPGRPTRDDIDHSPIALRYDPAPPAIVAQVVYVGADYSNRFGNYFAHTLVTPDPAADLVAPRPIELWRSPVWTNQESPTRELAALSAPLPAGTIDRSGVAAFLAVRGRSASLPVLLTCAERSIVAGDRPVVVVDTDADHNAHWVAALSYLLPPAVGDRMSFTTYHHRPGYCDQHVICTVPGADLEAGAEEIYFLFDVEGGRLPTLPAHPCGELLAAVGVVDAAALWARGAELVPLAPTTLDEAYPVALVACAAIGRLPSADVADAVDALVGLASHMERGAVVEVAGRMLDDGLHDLPLVERLAELAGTVDSVDLTVRCERLSVDLAMAASDAGLLEPSAVRRLTTGPAIERGRREVEGRLPLADLDRGVRLLGWARAAGVAIGGRVLAAYGHDVMAPGILAGADAGGLIALLAASSGLRHGVATAIDRVATVDRDAAAAVLDGPVARVWSDEELHTFPTVWRLARLRTARLEPARRVEVFDDLLGDAERRGGASPHAVGALLDELWPEGRWDVVDAGRLLALLTADQVCSGDLPAWFGASLVAHGAADDDAVRFASSLCAHRVGGVLPPEAAHLARWIDGTAALARRALAEGDEALDEADLAELDAAMRAAPAPPLGSFADAAAVVVWRAPSDRLATILATWPPSVVDRYMVLAAQRLAHPDAHAAAAAFAAAVVLEPTAPGASSGLFEVLRSTLPRWRRGDLEEVAKVLGATSPRYADLFLEWCEEHHAGSLVRRLFGRRRTSRPRA